MSLILLHCPLSFRLTSPLCKSFFFLSPLFTLVVDACNFTECAYYAVCISQRDGSARCECPDLCPTTFRPVCGSSLRTYWNECFLRREACFLQRNTTILFKQSCSKLS